MSDEILKLENVTIQFGGVVAVNDLSLDVKRGEIVALIGPNGAGKTTAFNCITGVYHPTNGRISFDGKPIIVSHPTGKDAKNYLGINADLFANEKVLSPLPNEVTELGLARTFQNIRLFSELTVLENVLIAKHMRAKQNFFSSALHLNGKEEKRMQDESLALLKEQGLDVYKNEKAGSLPYGLQRRLEIARALATNPQLLLLDEPAAGMNPQETAELGQFIVEIKNKYNLTILMIEHHMELVMKFSDKIYVIDFGKMISSGTPEEVQKDPKVIEAYLGVKDDE